jgi:hypothetical protein
MYVRLRTYRQDKRQFPAFRLFSTASKASFPTLQASPSMIVNSVNKQYFTRFTQKL